jgi:hypothetical protein
MKEALSNRITSDKETDSVSEQRHAGEWRKSWKLDIIVTLFYPNNYILTMNAVVNLWGSEYSQGKRVFYALCYVAAAGHNHSEFYIYNFVLIHIPPTFAVNNIIHVLPETHVTRWLAHIITKKRTSFLFSEDSQYYNNSCLVTRSILNSIRDTETHQCHDDKY